jgi:hypothetical protein
MGNTDNRENPDAQVETDAALRQPSLRHAPNQQTRESCLKVARTAAMNLHSPVRNNLRVPPRAPMRQAAPSKYCSQPQNALESQLRSIPT